MKLQKHYTRKDKSQWKFEVVIPEKLLKKAKLKAGDELEGSAKKGEVRLKKK